jgi:hypothetical protein
MLIILRRRGYFNILGLSYNGEMDNAEDLMPRYTDTVREISAKTRIVIKELIPGAIEQVDTSSKIIAYGYDHTYKGLICAIAPQKNYVNLMFSRGTELPDPAHLLEGTGAHARHVKLNTPADVGSQPLKNIILESVRLHGV